MDILGLIIAGIAIVLCVGGFYAYKFIVNGEKKDKQVIEHPINSVSISLDQPALSLKAGETAQLTATVQPDSATDKSVTWSSSNEGVAKVENGKVTAVAEEGKAEITASTGNGISASCEVTIPPIKKCPQCGKKLSECSGHDGKTYPCGKYVGSLKNGIPEGDGTMTYTHRVQIAKHDTQNPAHYAEAGDKFVGSWGNGDIVSGVLYDKNGVIKEKIFAPKRFNPYDISKDCN